MDLARHEGWEVPIIKTVSQKGEGIPKLMEAIDNHRTYLETSGPPRGHAPASAPAASSLPPPRPNSSRIFSPTRESNGRLEKLIEAIATRELDPHTAAEQLISKLKTDG